MGEDHQPVQLPAKMVRIEYEIPPLRAIYSVWYEDFADEDDETYRKSFASQHHPQAKIRKLERNIPSIVAEGEAFHDE